MCCYRDLKNFDRFNYVIQSLIVLVVTKLKDMKTLIANTEKLELKNLEIDKNNESNVASVTDEAADKQNDVEHTTAAIIKPSEPNEKLKIDSDDGDENKSKIDCVSIDNKKDDNSKMDDVWILPDLERVLLFISKVFLLNFPLYVAHKHGVHGRIDEISQQEIGQLAAFCDIHDTEIPVYLYRNVSLFCTNGGFTAMAAGFELPNLPVSTAHACTVAISNIKLWLNYRSIVQQFVPLRIKVLQYMCKLCDQDLRSPATKSMAGEIDLRLLDVSLICPNLF